MPDVDINPAALSRGDSEANGSTTPSASAKTLSVTAPPQKQPGKPSQSAPRVDIEPLYTALKKEIGDHWGVYKESIAKYVLGTLSQQELSRATDHFLLTDPNRLHLHNQLIMAIHCNVYRDPPEGSVAGWVSANDKPTSVSKPASGDAAEHRLRTEVMQLPPRTRHRLKGIHDEPPTPISTQITDLALARRPGTSTSLATSSHPTPASAQPASSLNRDAEIRRRYAQPLAQEVHDIPSAAQLQDRLIPICYEEGLSAGAASPTLCAELLGMALETILKSHLSNLLARSRANAPVSRPLGETNTTGAPGAAPVTSQVNPDGINTSHLGVAGAQGISTAAYKAAVDAEERAATRGELKRSEAGLLPVEVAALRTQGGGRGRPGDMALGWRLGDTVLGALAPWVGERVALGEAERSWYEGDGRELGNEREAGKTLANGTAGALVDGDSDALMGDDDADWGWQGAAPKERDALASLLDDCLTVGQ